MRPKQAGKPSNAEHVEHHAERRLAITPAVSVLVTDGVRPDLATRLAADLGLRHEPVPARPRVASDTP